MTNRVLIVGATSAIGEAVARRYAAEGDARLYLVARNSAHLASIADDLRIRGAREVETGHFLADDFASHARLVDDAWSVLGGIDVALIAHGSLPDQKACEAAFETARRELEVNALSAISLLTPLANRMADAGCGTIAVLSSVAGDRGRQSNYLYGCAKGCLNVFLQGLRHRLARFGINVLCIKPGFVDTPMTAEFEKGPLWASPEQVARDITRAIARGSGTLYTPWFWRWIMLAIRLLPPPLFHRTRL
jgi:short-subunit dehydrogenase